MSYVIISLSVIAGISVLINIFMLGYAKNTLRKIETVYNAAEASTEIFSLMDAFREHLSSVYEMPTFYGDETLKSLLDHTNEMIEYLKGYEQIYSFTQPELAQQLLQASEDMESDEEDIEA